MNKKFVLACLLSMMAVAISSAQIQRKNTGNSVSQSTLMPTEQSSSAEKEPVIIAIEDGVVYIDRPALGINIGDVFEAYEVTKKFTHPVTGEEIDGDPDVLAQLTVTKIFGKYIECEPSPKFAVSSLKPGIKVRKVSMDFSKPLETVGVEAKPDATSDDENEFQSLLRAEKAACPTKKTHGSFNESIEQEGKTIHFNIVCENGKIFKSIKKQINSNAPNFFKGAKTWKNLLFYNLGMKLGYTFIIRYHNKKRTEWAEFNLNDVVDGKI